MYNKALRALEPASIDLRREALTPEQTEAIELLCGKLTYVTLVHAPTHLSIVLQRPADYLRYRERVEHALQDSA